MEHQHPPQAGQGPPGPQPPPGGPANAPMPPMSMPMMPPAPVPQLPPQMFTTAAQLLDLTDSESPYFHDPNHHTDGAAGCRWG